MSVRHSKIHAWRKGQGQGKMIQNHHHRGDDLTSLVEISERVSTIEKTRGPRIESWNWEEGYYQGGDKEEIENGKE